MAIGAEVPLSSNANGGAFLLTHFADHLHIFGAVVVDVKQTTCFETPADDDRFGTAGDRLLLLLLACVPNTAPFGHSARIFDVINVIDGDFLHRCRMIESPNVYLAKCTFEHSTMATDGVDLEMID